MKTLAERVNKEQPQLIVVTVDGRISITSSMEGFVYRNHMPYADQLRKVTLLYEFHGTRKFLEQVEKIKDYLREGCVVYVISCSLQAHRELMILCEVNKIKSLWYSNIDGVEKIGTEDDIDIPQLDFDLEQSERYMKVMQNG